MQAEAMLAAGPGFWWQAGLRSESPENLAAAARSVREAEYTACNAIASRVEALVHRDATDREVWDFIALARETLRKTLGRQWSQVWARIGFPNSAQEIPQSSERRLLVLRSLGEYLRLNPQHQHENVGLTADHAQRLVSDAKTWLLVVEQCSGDVQLATEARKQAISEIKRIMRCLTAELHHILRENDPRWVTAYSAFPSTKLSTKSEPEVEKETLTSNTPDLEAFNQRVSRGRLTAHSNGSTTTRLARQAGLALSLMAKLPKTSRAICPTPHRPNVNLQSLNLLSLMAWLFPPHI